MVALCYIVGVGIYFVGGGAALLWFTTSSISNPFAETYAWVCLTSAVSGGTFFLFLGRALELLDDIKISLQATKSNSKAADEPKPDA